MANETDVNTARSALDSIWNNPPARDQRFGNALKSVSLNNIRGLSVTVELQWPVVAIGGINGCGKTTTLQVCSAAYTKSGTGKHYYTLGRWIGPALAGETPPISHPAEIKFGFWDTTPSLVVPYQVERTRWGYPRRGNPERNVAFVGIANFAPRIERLDRTHQNRARLNILATQKLDPRLVESVSRILGNPYDEVAFHTVSAPNAKWRDEIPELARGGHRYTEGHMGAGEQKAVRLIQFIEQISDHSLVLLEEPELTLHPDAQFGLAWYLMTLAKRKGHQIIIATHSPYIFEALPTEARVLLMRDNAGVAVLHSVTHLSAARELSASVRSNRDLVFVEDEVASRFLTEIWRRLAPDLLKSATIIQIGSSADVQRMVDRLRGQGVRAVGIRDPDQGDAPSQGLFSLPGDCSPEQLLLDDNNLGRAEKLLGGIKAAACRAKVQGHGYAGSEAAKRIFAGLCSELEMSSDFIADRLTLALLSETAWEEESKRLLVSLRQAFE
jgi:predicted ATPase